MISWIVPFVGFAQKVSAVVFTGFAVRCEAVALPRRNKCWMIRGCAAGAGFALILAEPKAGPGAEPMLRVTLPAGQSHRLTSAKPNSTLRPTFCAKFRLSRKTRTIHEIT